MKSQVSLHLWSYSSQMELCSSVWQDNFHWIYLLLPYFLNFRRRKDRAISYTRLILLLAHSIYKSVCYIARSKDFCSTRGRARRSKTKNCFGAGKNRKKHRHPPQRMKKVHIGLDIGSRGMPDFDLSSISWEYSHLLSESTIQVERARPTLFRVRLI